MNDKDIRNQLAGLFSDIVPESEVEKGESPLEEAIVGPTEAAMAEAGVIEGEEVGTVPALATEAPPPAPAKPAEANLPRERKPFAPPVSESKMKLPLRIKFALGFLVVALVTAALGFFSLRTYGNIHEEFSLLKEDIVPGALSILETEVALQALLRQVDEIVFTGDVTHRERALEDAERMLESMAEHVAIGERLGSEEYQDMLAIEDQAEQIANLANQVMDAVEDTGGKQTEIENTMGQMHTNAEALVAIIEADVVEHRNELAEAEENMRQAHAAGVQAVWAAIAVALMLSLGVGFYMARSVLRPISILGAAAERIRRGDLDVVADVSSGDEIGALATVFNSMTARLRETLTGLERRVAERTQALNLAAEVGRRLSTVRDLDTLLAEAVELIRENFDLYYTQIYLVDPAGHNLALRAGTGEVGAELVRRGHALPIGPGSINGTAAAGKQAIIVSDTAQSATFLPNPLLPDTRSEMAVPLLVGERVVGVLNLQDDQPGSLSDANLPAFEALAGQFAIAVDNANLFTEAAQARAEVEAQARRLAHKGWQEFLDGVERSERIGYAYEGDALEPIVEPLAAPPAPHVLAAPIQVHDAPVGAIQIEGEAGRAWTEAETELVVSVARQVAQQAENLRLLAQADQYRAQAEQTSRRLTREGWQTYLEAQTESASGFIYDRYEVKPLVAEGETPEPVLSRPLQVRGETIGQLAVGEVGPLDDEATELMTTIAERLSAHIESLRLYEETRNREHELDERGQELEASQRVTFAAAETADPDELLDLVVNLIRDQFDLYHAQVYLVDEEKQAAVLRKSTGYAGRQLLERGHQIPLEQPALVTRAIRQGEPVVVADVSAEEGWLANPLLPHTRSEMVVPLKAGGDVIGALDVQSRTADRFTPATVTLFQTMAEQVAMSFETTDLLIRTTEQAETLTLFSTQLRTAADVAERLSAILDPDQLLHEVVELMQSRFGLYHAHVYLLDKVEAEGEVKDKLVVRAGSGEVGRVLLERGHSIPIDAEHSLVARAARERQPVIVDNTSLDSDFMPNPLLPETRSELAVPLVAGDKVLGVLDVQDNQASRFSEADQATFSTLAGQIATALQNADLFEEQKRAEQALTESEKEFRTLYEATGDAVMLLDDKSFFDCNQATLRVFGCETRDQFVGKHPSEFSPEYQPNGQDSDSLAAQQIETASREGSNFFEWQHMQLDGTEFPAEVLLTAMEIRGRQVLQAVVRDITERKRIEEETHIRFEISQALAGAQTEEDVLDAMIQVAGFDPAAQVALATYDLATEEPTLVVRRVSSFEGNVAPVEIGSRFSASRFQIIDQFSPGEPLVVSNLSTDERVDPAARQFLSGLGVVSMAIITIATSDEQIGVLRASSSEEGVFDERKLYLYQSLAEQSAVALYAARLFDEIQQAAERLREMDRLKSEFLANMSHELRTPLNSILGYAELLLMDMATGEELDSESIEDMRSIYSNGKHLLNLINDVLDLAKIEAGRLTLNLEEMCIEPLLDEVKTSNAGLFINKPVDLIVEVAGEIPAIQADSVRIHQVLNNLVSNAVKFTEEGTVSLRTFSDADWVYIEVEDTGIGVSENDLETIFERFRQVDGSFTRRAEGTGLGLSITRHLVEMHGGTIDVRSQPGQGSTFAVRLPIQRQEAGASDRSGDGEESGD